LVHSFKGIDFCCRKKTAKKNGSLEDLSPKFTVAFFDVIEESWETAKIPKLRNLICVPQKAISLTFHFEPFYLITGRETRAQILV